MNKRRVAKVVKVFEKMVLLQDRYDELFNELSEEEEAEFEKEVMAQGFTINKTKPIGDNKDA